ncbi:hypothetical protein [Microbacterium luteum]|nr:hypothetical protein [Microbacterium luteum]
MSTVTPGAAVEASTAIPSALVRLNHTARAIGVTATTATMKTM